MHFAILAILIVLVIGFFVVIWKAAPHWRWYQLVAVSVTMLLAVAFLFPTAGVLKSRSAWHELKESLDVRLEQVLAENRRLEDGSPDDPGVVPLSQELSKLGSEAGRRWRGLQMQNATADSVTLVRPQRPQVPGGEAPPPDAQALPLVPDGMVVYGFAELQQNGSPPLPRFFLGEFQVVASDPNQVQLKPTGVLEPAQANAISSGEANRWSLYELLPLDGHQPFIAEGSVESDERVFGRVDDDLVRSLLEREVQDPQLQQTFSDTLDEYLRDGTPADSDDPPESRWIKIEFIKKHSITVDSTEQRGALEGGYFDRDGRAVDSRLQLGDGTPGSGDVTFNVGDRLVLKEDAPDSLNGQGITADELIAQGIAKPLGRYFVRPLNDYRYVLRRSRLRLRDLAVRKSELEFENKVLTDAIDKTVKIIGEYQGMRNKLEQDVAQVEVEVKAMTAYQQEAAAALKEVREKLSRLYQDNQRLVEELQRIHRSIEQRVDSLTLAP